MKYNYIDLFAGVGGFAYGAWLAGMKFENHFFSEIEPYAVELYQKRFPDAIPLGDITKIKTAGLKKYGTEWIITGGFPCHDISIAGKGEGIHGERSGLWFAYRKVIRDLRPRFAIVENVGMFTHRGLREVLGSLAEIGYNAEWQDIWASDAGAPQKRERIWVVAYPVGFRVGGPVESISFKEMRQRGESGKANMFNQRDFRPGYDCDSESELCRANDGASHRVDRLRGLGNSIIPQIAAFLFQRIKLYL